MVVLVDETKHCIPEGERDAGRFHEINDHVFIRVGTVVFRTWAIITADHAIVMSRGISTTAIDHERVPGQARVSASRVFFELPGKEWLKDIVDDNHVDLGQGDALEKMLQEQVDSYVSLREPIDLSGLSRKAKKNVKREHGNAIQQMKRYVFVIPPG